MERALSVGLAVWVVATTGCKAPGESLRVSEEEGLPAPGPLLLTFQPAAGRTLIERTRTVRTERSTAPESAASPSRESMEAVLATRFEPAEGGRWLLTQQVTSVVVEVGGRPVVNALMTLVTRFPMRLEIAADAAFVRYVNPEAAEAAVRETFPDPAETAAVLTYFSPRALEEQARREWGARYGGLFHRKLEPGTAFYAVETVALSSGEQLAYGVERRVLGPVRTDYGDGVALGIRCLGRTEGPGREELERLMAERGVEALEPSVACEGRQELVDRPFVPVRTVVHLTARAAASGGAPVEITFDTTTAAERLE